MSFYIGTLKAISSPTCSRFLLIFFLYVWFSHQKPLHSALYWVWLRVKLIQWMCVKSSLKQNFKFCSSLQTIILLFNRRVSLTGIHYSLETKRSQNSQKYNSSKRCSTTNWNYKLLEHATKISTQLWELKGVFRLDE